MNKRLSFSRRYRLVDARQYKQVFDQPIKAGDGVFLALAQTNHLGYARLGLAISKKHIKTAVARNRIKRVVRESFRHYKDELTGLDVVVLTKAIAATMDKITLREHIDRQWKRLAQRSKQASCA